MTEAQVTQAETDQSGVDTPDSLVPAKVHGGGQGASKRRSGAGMRVRGVALGWASSLLACPALAFGRPGSLLARSVLAFGRAGSLLARSALAYSALALFTVVPVAVAAPKVTLKVTPTPIPGFPGTGNILGAGTDVEAAVTIAGTEYDGSPSPVTGLTFYTPAGVKVDTRGFKACDPSVFATNGAAGCPKSSSAGPIGEGLGVVSFGATRVDEKVSIQAFFAPGGGLNFYVEGTTPAFFEVLEKGQWSTAGAPYGPRLAVEVPLVETVPGADDASILSFKVKLGAAYEKAGKAVSYFTLPKSCPKGGAPLKFELKFLSGETTTVAFRQPCPKR